MTAAAIGDQLKDALPDVDLLAGDLDRFTIAGVRPGVAVRPRGAEQVAGALRLAGEHGWAVAPVGGGTMLDLGNPPVRLDLAIDLSALAAVVDYQPDDLTLTVQAGITVARIGRLLAEHGQMLPLDVPLPERATIGGALACDSSGPLALRFGTARDLVIGMQVALPQHGLARSGGKVVKNVAGYDLAKLHIGGLGTLGIITEVTFKLWPAPTADGAILAAFTTQDAAHAAAQQILAGQLFPAALELLGGEVPAALLTGTGMAADAGHCFLAARLLGTAAAVERQSRDLGTLCSRAGALRVGPLDAAGKTSLFDRLRDFGRADAPSALLLRASVLPSQTAIALGVLQEAGERVGAVPALLARPGRGRVQAWWQEIGDADAASASQAARTVIAGHGGQLLVERAPNGALRELDRWGLDGPDLALMRRLKRAYDPRSVLNPGRYVGGI
ncbi:MAG TPA: FAD-binding oxidoreductase [Dehalococcoidia bacterium]|nr:FAD-binding oxidoreductase [Dehalococcoidia bacterium]